MGGWFSKKSKDEDYEQILASLAVSISSRQQRLSEIRLRERRATLLCTLYALAVWGLYVAIWYLGLLAPSRGGREFSGRGRDRVQEAVRAIPVFIGPVVVLFMRRIVQWWYHRVEAAEEKALRKLVTEQRTKIEEIKKKTNYYSTRNLLERYDAPPGAPGAPGARPTDSNQQLRQRTNKGQPGLEPGRKPADGAATVTNGSASPGAPNGVNASTTNGLAANKRTQDPSKLSMLSPTALPPPTPPRKQWYDRVADALLGDELATPAGAEQRYALICEKCYMHNGLVKEEWFEDAQYICPRCGHFNASIRARKSGLTTAATSAHVTPAGFSPFPQGHAPGMPMQPQIEGLLYPRAKAPGRRSPSPGPLPSSPLRFSHEMPSSSPPESPSPAGGVTTHLQRSVSPVDDGPGMDVDK